MKLSLLAFVPALLVPGCAVDSAHVASDTLADTAAADSTYDSTLRFDFARTGFGEPTPSAVIAAGSTLSVEYDALRLVEMNPRCAYEPSSPDGVVRTSIDMGLRINGDSTRVYNFTRVSLYGAEGVTSASKANNKVALPEDTRSIELWFSCHATVSGFVAYDSKFGVNYKFAVAAKVLPPSRYDAWPKTVTTGIKNGVDVARWYDSSVFPGRDDSYYYPTHVEVAYDDLNDFAKGATTIAAQIGVHTATSGHGHTDTKPTQWFSVTLTRQGQRFVGQVDLQLWGIGGLTDHRVTEVEVAVTNGADWDSDLGRNYHVRF